MLWIWTETLNVVSVVVWDGVLEDVILSEVVAETVAHGNILIDRALFYACFSAIFEGRCQRELRQISNCHL